MKTEDHIKVKMAFRFFSENVGTEINLDDLAAVAGWKPSTTRTYFNKKWKGLILERSSPGRYRVIMPATMRLEDFGELHTQISEKVH